MKYWRAFGYLPLALLLSAAPAWTYPSVTIKSCWDGDVPLGAGRRSGCSDRLSSQAKGTRTGQGCTESLTPRGGGKAEFAASAGPLWPHGG